MASFVLILSACAGDTHDAANSTPTGEREVVTETVTVQPAAVTETVTHTIEVTVEAEPTAPFEDPAVQRRVEGLMLTGFIEDWFYGETREGQMDLCLGWTYRSDELTDTFVEGYQSTVEGPLVLTDSDVGDIVREVFDRVCNEEWGQ